MDENYQYFFYISVVLVLANGDDILRIAASAKAQGLFDGRFAFISLDLYNWESAEWKPNWLNNYPDDVLTGWFDVSSQSLAFQRTPEYDKFETDMKLRLLQKPFYVQINKVSIFMCLLLIF